ncbi:hypothetical protein C8F01DRAFT_716939 [Mycena amicta]|nr:hypothetical protein C8F01DRAFT_716939 [Mycena amicta]
MRTEPRPRENELVPAPPVVKRVDSDDQTRPRTPRGGIRRGNTKTGYLPRDSPPSARIPHPHPCRRRPSPPRVRQRQRLRQLQVRAAVPVSRGELERERLRLTLALALSREWRIPLVRRRIQPLNRVRVYPKHLPPTHPSHMSATLQPYCMRRFAAPTALHCSQVWAQLTVTCSPTRRRSTHAARAAFDIEGARGRRRENVSASSGRYTFSIRFFSLLPAPAVVARRRQTLSVLIHALRGGLIRRRCVFATRPTRCPGGIRAGERTRVSMSGIWETPMQARRSILSTHTYLVPDWITQYAVPILKQATRSLPPPNSWRASTSSQRRPCVAVRWMCTRIVRHTDGDLPVAKRSSSFSWRLFYSNVSAEPRGRANLSPGLSSSIELFRSRLGPDCDIQVASPNKQTMCLRDEVAER